MNKRQVEVQQQFLNNEKAVLKKLEANYQDALAEINSKIELLLARQDADMAHVIYQVHYQEALKDQVSAILEQLHNNEFETLSEYLTLSYEDGFTGTMYDLQGQGIPLVIPIDQKQVAAAIQHETRLSESLYAALGQDTKELSRKIAGEISRGISGGMMYAEIARNIAAWGRIPMNNAMRIARTETHRIQCKATMDAQRKAKDKGADVVKQWDSSLDKRTRDSHVKVDGEIRELDDTFSNGLLYPGDPSGRANEVINCRCALLQRARWNLGSDYTKWSPDVPVEIPDDGTAQLIDMSGVKNYRDFKKAYSGLAAKIGGVGVPEHEEPKLLKIIEYSDKKAVMNEISTFESHAVKESIEMACVITSVGEVYQCFGVEDGVFPDFDLKEKLYGATISHNHPVGETTYSFSDIDLQLFMDYNLEILRGCDEIYTYEFTRDSKAIDEQLTEWFTKENYQHCAVINKAKQYGIGYKRWENE